MIWFICGVFLTQGSSYEYNENNKLLTIWWVEHFRWIAVDRTIFVCHSIPNSYLGICIYIVYLHRIVSVSVMWRTEWKVNGTWNHWLFQKQQQTNFAQFFVNQSATAAIFFGCDNEPANIDDEVNGEINLPLFVNSIWCALLTWADEIHMQTKSTIALQ